MAEELKNLIDKIQQEGVVAAQKKAKEIEGEAERRAEEIVRKAEAQAKKTLEEAREKIAKDQAAAEATLKQAGRDLVLALKKEIGLLLQKLVMADLRRALTPEELAGSIVTLIKNYSGPSQKDVVVSLKEEDVKKLAEGFLGQLKKEAKKGITLRSSDEVSAGFIISFDEGKSHFDFTDKALAEYLSGYLRPRLAALLK